MNNEYEDNLNIEPDPIEDDFVNEDDFRDDEADDRDFDEDQEDGDDFPERMEWEEIEGPQDDGYGNDMDGFDFPEFDG